MSGTEWGEQTQVERGHRRKLRGQRKQGTYEDSKGRRLAEAQDAKLMKF